MTRPDHPSGYARPWVVAAGQRVALHADLPGATTVDVVRIACANAERHADGRPWGPPERIVPVAALGSLAARPQPLDAGTQVLAASAAMPAWDGLTLLVAVQRQPRGHGGAVAALVGDGGALRIDVQVAADDAGQLVVTLDGAVPLRWPLPGADWLLLRLDMAAQHLRWCHAPVRADVPDGVPDGWGDGGTVPRSAPGGRPAQLRLGRRGDGLPTADVRVDLLSVLPTTDVGAHGPRALLADDAAWERAVQGRSCLLRARPGTGGSTQDLSGSARITEAQRPTVSVRGVRWSGRWHDPRAAGAHFSALQLHGDTLLDAHWASVLDWEVPAGLASGAYAFRLQLPGQPPVHASFFVSAAAGPLPRPAARLAVWLPTYSYLAYGNAVESMRGPAVTPVPRIDEHRLDALHPAHGRSLYERHADGQGVLWTGSRRPLWSVAPGHRPWQFVADSWLLDWLERSGIPCDVITDHDVHRRGADALAPYAAVLTGHHPEYVSEAMWNGLWRYLHGGGRLMYLGGNGYYWRTAVDEHDDLIEVRRAEDGTRPFVGAAGESYAAFDGACGGLWRRLGRAPQQIVGVGMAAQGFDRSAPYRKRPDADAAAMAFVFDGVDAPLFGAQGCWGGGASGWEIDRADADLGTPPGTWWLARSEGHAPSMLRTKEELLSYVEPFRDAKARSDVVLAPVGRGHVFAVGSMTWVGALWTPDGTPTDVARVTANVLARFLDPAPLPVRG